jgi:hypothetical protein
MTGTAAPVTSERAEPVDPPSRPPQRRRRRRLMVAATLVTVLAAGAYVERTNPHGISLSHPLGYRPHDASAVRDNEAATSLAPIERRSLSTQTQLNGTLGYAGSYTVLGRARGTVTWLPDPGQVIGNGQVLYRVDEAPVVLLSGSTPAYRTLAAGVTTADVTGADVAQLNHDLVALGYVPEADVHAAWDQFSWATVTGVEKLQKHLGAQQTGRLDLGAVVFLPTAARVTTLSASLGGPASGAVLRATSTARTVSVSLDADLQSEVKIGDRVTIMLPDDSTTPGVVISAGTVATDPSTSAGGADSGPTVPVTIRPTDATATGGLDQTPVVVSITDQTVSHVLVVPVTALLALAGGGYAVELVADDGTHHLVRATPGLFDNAAGLVQVSEAGLAPGQRVVVPGNG